MFNVNDNKIKFEVAKLTQGVKLGKQKLELYNYINSLQVDENDRSKLHEYVD